MSEPFLGNNNKSPSPTIPVAEKEGHNSLEGSIPSGEGSSAVVQNSERGEEEGISGDVGGNCSSASAPARTDLRSCSLFTTSSVISDECSSSFSNTILGTSTSRSSDINSDPTQVIPHYTSPPISLSSSCSSTGTGIKLAASSATSASSSSPSTPPNKSSLSNLNNLMNGTLFGSDFENRTMSTNHHRSDSMEETLTTTLSNLSLRGAPLTPQMSGDSGIFAWNGEETIAAPNYSYSEQVRPHYPSDGDYPNYNSRRAITGGGGSSSRPGPFNSSYSTQPSPFSGRGSYANPMSPNSPIGRHPQQDWPSVRSGVHGGFPNQGYGGSAGRVPYPQHSTPNGMGYPRPPKLNMPLRGPPRSPSSRPTMYDHLGEPPYSAPAETGMGDMSRAHPGARPFARPKNRTPFFPGNEYYNTSMVDGSAGKF